jgi:hypothetical protein
MAGESSARQLWHSRGGVTVTTLQKFVQMRSRQSRVGTGTALLMQPSEAEIRFAAYKEKQLRELRAIVFRDRIWGRLQMAASRAIGMLTERLRVVHRTSRRRAVGRARRSSRSPALSDPAPAQAVNSFATNSRPLCTYRTEAFLFVEHQNESARPASHALSKGNRDDVYFTITG